MCLQDQRMVSNGRLVTETITPPAGAYQIRNMSNALWFAAMQADGSDVPVYWSNQLGAWQRVPRFTEMIGSSGYQPYMLREHVGDLFRMPLYVFGDGVTTINIVSLEMDAETYNEIINAYRG